MLLLLLLLLFLLWSRVCWACALFPHAHPRLPPRTHTCRVCASCLVHVCDAEPPGPARGDMAARILRARFPCRKESVRLSFRRHGWRIKERGAAHHASVSLRPPPALGQKSVTPASALSERRFCVLLDARSPHTHTAPPISGRHGRRSALRIGWSMCCVDRPFAWEPVE